MFFRFELSFDFLTCVNGLDNGINLSTEINELVSYLFADFWSLNGKTILLRAACSSLSTYILGDFHLNKMIEYFLREF